MCILLHRSNLGNFANLHQCFVDSAEISQQKLANFAKVRENLDIYAKKNCEKSARLEIAAVQKDANLVDLEKCSKMRLWSLS